VLKNQNRRVRLHDDFEGRAVTGDKQGVNRADAFPNRFFLELYNIMY